MQVLSASYTQNWERQMVLSLFICFLYSEENNIYILYSEENILKITWQHIMKTSGGDGINYCVMLATFLAENPYLGNAALTLCTLALGDWECLQPAAASLYGCQRHSSGVAF
jgi:hypothetical protein